MNPEKCVIDEEEIYENSETCSSSTNNKIKLSTSSKSRRSSSQKLSWIPSPEKETYRTVVVNYRYAKMDKNYPRNTGAISKKKHWSRMMASMAAKRSANEVEEDEDEVPNLRKLYDCSKEDLTCEYKTPDTPVPSCENIAATRQGQHQPPTKEAIKLEFYCLPVEQEAIVEEHQLNTIEEGEVEQLNLTLDDSGEQNEDEMKSPEYSDERIDEGTDNSTGTTKMNLSGVCKNFVLLRDNEIGETPDFDADFCCAMTKDKVDGTQQTCIIKNTTKGTQKPERHSERLQTARRSRARAVSEPNKQTDENCLQLTVAEIPKDTGKPKSTSTQGGFRQRQQELHRYRIAVEQKRLELLEVKLQRERDEMLREQILFEKELELKASQLSQMNDDRTVDIL